MAERTTGGQREHLSRHPEDRIFSTQARSPFLIHSQMARCTSKRGIDYRCSLHVERKRAKMKGWTPIRGDTQHCDLRLLCTLHN